MAEVCGKLQSKAVGLEKIPASQQGALCVDHHGTDRTSTLPSPSGGNPARLEAAPSCTAEKPTEGLESTSPLHHTHMHTQTHAFQK